MRLRDRLFRLAVMPGWLVGFGCAAVAAAALLAGDGGLALSAGLAAGALFLVAQLLFGWQWQR